jgi:putative DNA primase/helicase
MGGCSVTSWPSPAEPLQVAKQVLETRFCWRYAPGLSPVDTLRSWRSCWWKWDISKWVEISVADLESVLYDLLDDATFTTVVEKKDGPEIKVKPWAPNRHKISDVVHALSALTLLTDDTDAPCWLDDDPYSPPADELVAVANGLLHITTRELMPHTPRFFNVVAVGFDYTPDAPRPVLWQEFLDELWHADPDSLDALAEFIGYVLSGRTDLQKIFLMIGPTRSGKGTIARIISALVGRGHVAGPTLSSLSTNFGLAPLIGKPLAVISDARLGRGDAHQVVERLLSISGEDLLTIDRKFKEPWTGKIPSRFLIQSNELPNFGDASGAIANRFVILLMRKSFLGKENTQLTTDLLAELPGILLWALDGLDRLTKTGVFTVPQSSLDASLALQDLVSPVSAFVRDRCDVGPDQWVERPELYRTWKQWCDENGRRASYEGTFGRDLRAVVPMVRDERPRTGDTRIRIYTGIGLRTQVTMANNVDHLDQADQNGRSGPPGPGGPGSSALWPIQVCSDCSQPMTVVEPGQTTHPGCSAA